MDEKLIEAMKGMYDNLTDVQKEKWNACKTEEEFIKFMSDEGIELPDEFVGVVSGGNNSEIPSIFEHTKALMREIPGGGTMPPRLSAEMISLRKKNKHV